MKQMSQCVLRHHLLSVFPATSSPGHTRPPCHRPADNNRIQAKKHSSLYLLQCHCHDNNVLMHLHMFHPVPHRFSVSLSGTQRGFTEHYLICSIPGNVTDVRDGLVFPGGPVLRRTHCCWLSNPLEIQWHQTTTKTATVTIAATAPLINFSTSLPGGGLNLDLPTSLTQSKTQ